MTDLSNGGNVDTFDSEIISAGAVNLPDFSNTRIMMMPLILGDEKSIPSFLSSWTGTLRSLFAKQSFNGRVGYLTIDEKTINAGETHRRSGKHVDGVFGKGAGGWGGGWGGGADDGSSTGTGFLTVSSVEGCRAWTGSFTGFPDDEGGCKHLEGQCTDSNEATLRSSIAYWVGPLCVHESMPMPQKTKRQFVRLSLPSNAPWFEGYTANPLGVKPTGPILPRRSFMDN